MTTTANHSPRNAASARGPSAVTIYFMSRAYYKAFAPVVWYVLGGVGCALAPIGGITARVGYVLFLAGFLGGVGGVVHSCKS